MLTKNIPAKVVLCAAPSILAGQPNRNRILQRPRLRCSGLHGDKHTQSDLLPGLKICSIHIPLSVRITLVIRPNEDMHQRHKTRRMCQRGNRWGHISPKCVTPSRTFSHDQQACRIQICNGRNGVCIDVVRLKMNTAQKMEEDERAY